MLEMGLRLGRYAEAPAARAAAQNAAAESGGRVDIRARMIDNRGMAGAESGALQALLARSEIEAGLIAYAHALDQHDWPRLHQVFVADVRFRYGDMPWMNGVAEVVRVCSEVLERLDASQHRISSIAVQPGGAQTATSRCYVAAEHLRGGRRYTIGGSYLDSWRRTAEGFRIAQRELVITWDEGDPSVIAP